MNNSIMAVSEVGGAGMLLFIMFSLSWLYREGGHLRATFLVSRLPQRHYNILTFILSILSLAFVCFATYNWWRMLSSTLYAERILPMMRIPEWPFQASALVAWALLALVVLGDVIEQGGLLLGKISYIEKRAEHIEVKG